MSIGLRRIADEEVGVYNFHKLIPSCQGVVLEDESAHRTSILHTNLLDYSTMGARKYVLLE